MLSRIEPQRIDPSSVKNILLIRLRRIGDIVLTTPAVSALRQRFPQSHISYVVEEPYKELMEGNPDINEVIVLPVKLGMKDFFRLTASIRSRKFDILVDFHGGPRAFMISLFVKAKVKIGYRLKYKHIFYDIKLPRKPAVGYFHSVESHYNLVSVLGIPTENIPRLYLPPALKGEKNRVKKLLKEKKLDRSKFVILHICAGNIFRQWGERNLRKLIHLLSSHPKTKIVLIGSKKDIPIGKKLVSKDREFVFSFVGKLNLRELRELISCSSLFIGPDSGPMHIAASTSTPIVAYFGPALPASFKPWKAKSIILEKDLDCRPCKQKKCLHQDYRCLQSITPEEVFKASLKFL